MAAAAALSPAPDYVRLEEMQKRKSDAQEIVVVSSDDPLMANLASLQASCQQTWGRLSAQVNSFAAEADALKKCPSPSWIRARFKRENYAEQQQQRDEFIQVRLDKYKVLYNAYQEILSPALIEQVNTIVRILKSGYLNRLGEVLDIDITRSVTADKSLSKLRKKFEEICKKEIDPISESCSSILRLIEHIKETGKDIFNEMRTFHERLNKLCKTSDSIH